MRLTELIWSCTTCCKDFEVFSDDEANDLSVCWNWCPHCAAKNEIWKRFKSPNESILSGIGCEEAMKCFPKQEKIREEKGNGGIGMKKQIFIINSDLKMGIGKIAVQVAHGEVFYLETVLTPGSDNEKERSIRYADWRLRDNGLMKKVVLKATEKEMQEFTWKLKGKVWAYPVFDRGLTQVPTDSFTCLVIEPLPEKQCNELFGHLKLV